MPVLGPVRGMILPWRQALYVVAMSVLFLIVFHYMLSHRHNWWGWVAWSCSLWPMRSSSSSGDDRRPRRNHCHYTGP
jgi:hypothetical protein